MKLIRLKDKDLTWEVDGKNVGKGFKTKEDTNALTRCPECLSENYAMAVISGVCCWCGFNANEELPK